MRLVFAGTPDFAASALKALLGTHHTIVGVYSQPDRPAGRGRKLQPSPVKQVALDNSIPVFQPETLRTPEAQQELANLQPDVMIVAAYGLILPQAVLEIPAHGCLNIHASLLPRWRGAAPIQRAIAAGDKETGITIMQMDKGLDTGAMLLKSRTAIEASDTGGSLHDRLAELGGDAIIEALTQLESSKLIGETQNDGDACYAHKLSKEEGHIDWSQDAPAIERLIRAFNPWPGTYTDLEQQRLRIHEATAIDEQSQKPPGTVLKREREGIDVACGTGTLRINRLQLPGSRAQSVNDLINGGKQLLLPGQELR
ncbi:MULTISPECIES: methionyl-tRNA formyltransferase [unclassified Marinobacter]|uniref:methionyl-tRNA formyltransferase n=1 Tax=unclassified Marinobacter TaxID=83889 RepID=UPI0026E3D032|nr:MULTISPECIES: methionyl-tRNA formyltransferase [unclassified Marinobacter]MDO6441820.1 methionyl-tRNA formyltransferase [Marinobacter sp. 2_MG-2023]MDO6824795.1 methionyl-tRNA formyltransferase [Marinobacter sp. 1_MG-2023]